MKKRKDLKILLLQIRKDGRTLEEEHIKFAQFADIEKEQITCFNAYTQNEFEPSIIDGHDALFVGGSSDASVLDIKKYSFVIPCQKLIRHCYDAAIPTLASCFGFQLACQEFDGKVIEDKANMEMGMYPIALSDAAKEDKLLFDYPKQFWAISGHKERAKTLPKKCLSLGSTELCPYHIFTFKEKPFYGFQFHPEIDKQTLHQRLYRYAERYLEGEEQINLILENAKHETDIANKIIYDFVDRIILNTKIP